MSYFFNVALRGFAKQNIGQRLQTLKSIKRSFWRHAQNRYALAGENEK
jgi:hypothetical protein